MTRNLLILTLLCLAGCGTSSIRPVLKAPVPKELPGEIAALCPSLRLLENPTSYGAFLLLAGEDAIEYAKCQAKHAAAVAAYNTARQAAIDTNKAGK